MLRRFTHVIPKGEDQVRKIEGVGKEEGHQLVIYDGDSVVGRFSLDKIEQWSIEEEPEPTPHLSPTNGC